MHVLLFSLFFSNVPLGCQAKLKNRTEFLRHHEDFGFLDYEVTDIWWRTTQRRPQRTTTQQTEMAPHQLLRESTYKQEAGDLSNQLTSEQPEQQTLPSLSENPVQLQTELPNNTESVATDITHSTIETSQPEEEDLPGTTENIKFVEEMINTMTEDNNGYFTAFIVKFMELLVMKNFDDEVIPVLNSFEKIIRDSVPETTNINDQYGDYPIQVNLINIIDMLKNMTYLEVREFLGPFHYGLKTKMKLRPDEYSSFYNYIVDQIYTETEGITLFKALEEFAKYPNGGKFGEEVAVDILTAALEPFRRVYSIKDYYEVVSFLNRAYKSKTLFWAIPEVELESTTTSHNIVKTS